MISLLSIISLVQLDLEDPTLLEIAEILDSQAGDKYTVMLVRNTEDMDNASFVHVQMLNEDGRESIRYVCGWGVCHFCAWKEVEIV